MGGEPLKVDHLCPEGCKMGQKMGLAGAGAAVDKADGGGKRFFIKRAGDEAAVGLIAALDGVGLPADLLQDDGEGARTLTAAPAIDQRTPAAVTIRKRALKMGGGIARDEGCADLAREKTVLLHIDRAHAGAFLVREDGKIERAGDVILCEFGGGSDVDHLVKGQSGERRETIEGNGHQGKTG